MRARLAGAVVLLAALVAGAPFAARAQTPSADAAQLAAAADAARTSKEYERAIALWKAALAALGPQGDPAQRAHDWGQLAGTYRDAGDATGELDALNNAIAVDAAAGRAADQAGYLETAGLLQTELGRPRDALASHQAALQLFRALDNVAGVAEEELHVAFAQHQLGADDDALAAYDRSFAAYQTRADAKGEATVWYLRGFSLEALHRTAAALDAYRTAETMQRAGGDDVGAARALEAQADLERRLGRFDAAIAAYQAAIALRNRHGDQAVEADDLFALGQTELNDQQHEREADARAVFEQARDRYHALGNTAREQASRGELALIQWYFGSTAVDAGDGAQAIALFRPALADVLPLAQASPQLHDAAAQHLVVYPTFRLQMSIGLVAERQNDLDGAAADYRAALRTAALDPDQSLTYEAADRLGFVLGEAGRLREALAVQLPLAQAAHDRGDVAMEAHELLNVGGIYARLDDADHALPAFQRVVELAGTKPDWRDLKRLALGNLGVVYDQLGDYDAELALEQSALADDRDPLSQEIELVNMATAQFRLGRLDDALATIARLRAVAGSTGIDEYVGHALELLGRIRAYQGNSAAALDAFHQALQISREIHSPLGEATILRDMADDLLSIGNLAFAQNALDQARHLSRQIGDVALEGDVLIELAQIARLQGRPNEALRDALAADAICARLGMATQRPLALNAVALAQANLGHRQPAVTAFEASLRDIEAVRSSIQGSDSEAFFGNFLGLYDDYIAFLVRASGRPDSADARRAFEIFERKAARALLDELSASSVAHFRGVPAAVAEQERRAAGGVEQARTHVETLREAGAEQAVIRSAEARLAAARTSLAAVDGTIRARYPAYDALLHPRFFSPDQLQRSVLAPGEVLLAYDVTDARTLVWAVSRTQFRVAILPGSAAVRGRVDALRKHIDDLLALIDTGIATDAVVDAQAQRDLPAFARDANVLERLLVPPALGSVVAAAKRVVIVPTGPLVDVPWEALVTSVGRDGTPHYLADDVAISYTPSASVLGLQRTARTGRRAAPQPLLAFARPAYGTPAGGDAPSFPDLPATLVEADGVRAALGAPAASVLSGEDASRDRLLALNASGALAGYRYLLFATHAVVPDTVLGVSQAALVLAHPERGTGMVTAADIFGLTLDADFVALSGCDTGAGDHSVGAGVSTLTRAFLYAGAPAISVNLWELDDAAGAQLEARFFAGMAAGRPPADALRAAKRALMRDRQPRFRHPYAWASTVIFGDGDGG